MSRVVFGEPKVKYSDLSTPLKVAVVFAYIIGIAYALAFCIGFIIGIMEATI